MIRAFHKGEGEAPSPHISSDEGRGGGEPSWGEKYHAAQKGKIRRGVLMSQFKTKKKRTTQRFLKN